jgi:hypothetical protein
MIDRRAFIEGAAALTALMLPAASAPAMPLHKVIFEAGDPQSALFGAAAQELGAEVHAIRSDVTDLWHDDLFEQNSIIAGMTYFHSFFAIEMLAADTGLRAIYRGHHYRVSSGSTSHDVFGPKRAMHRIKFDGSDADWSRNIAKTLTSWPANHMTIAKSLSTIGEARGQGVKSDTLVSWLMARPSRS